MVLFQQNFPSATFCAARCAALGVSVCNAYKYSGGACTYGIYTENAGATGAAVTVFVKA